MNVTEIHTNKGPSTQIETWRLDIANRLNRFCIAAKKFNDGLFVAQEYLTDSVSKLSGYSSMARVLHKWLVDVCEQANIDADNETHVSISVSDLSTTIKEFDFPSKQRYADNKDIIPGKRFYDATDEELATWLVENFDYEKLEKQIKALTDNLNRRGLKDAAETLGWKFGLLKRGYYNEGPVELKMQKGRYILDISNSGSWRHDRISGLQTLKVAANTFEKEANVSGLSYCLQMAIDEEESLPSNFDYSIPSRTKIATDSNVSGTFFHQKIKLAFEPEYFEALVGLIQEFSDKEMNEIIVS